jgi:hypothetical protein
MASLVRVKIKTAGKATAATVRKFKMVDRVFDKLLVFMT